MTDDALPGTPDPSPERPRWSLTEAARRCGVGRATLQRRLAAGAIPGAVRGDKGWELPLEGLLAAGFVPDRPSAAGDPPASTTRPAREPARAPEPTGPEHAQRIAELEAALAAERARADLEAARRAAAEQVAAIQAERVADLRHALRMIEAARPEPSPPPEPASPAPVPARRSGLLGRLLGE